MRNGRYIRRRETDIYGGEIVDVDVDMMMLT